MLNELMSTRQDDTVTCDSGAVLDGLHFWLLKQLDNQVELLKSPVPTTEDFEIAISSVFALNAACNMLLDYRRIHHV